MNQARKSLEGNSKLELRIRIKNKSLERIALLFAKCTMFNTLCRSMRRSGRPHKQSKARTQNATLGSTEESEGESSHPRVRVRWKNNS